MCVLAREGLSSLIALFSLRHIMLLPANSRTLSFVYIVGLQSCMDKPCANGTCTDIKKGGVKCDCLPGFAGDYCTRK